jgi:hypothetical protein
MSYRLTITRLEANPNFETEMTKWERARDSRFGVIADGGYPVPTMEVRKLEVEITDEEFAAVKKAVLELQ